MFSDSRWYKYCSCLSETLAIFFIFSRCTRELLQRIATQPNFFRNIVLALSIVVYFIFNGDSMAMGKGKDKKGVKSEEGVGGIFRTFGSFLDLLSDMVEKGETEVRREGEVELGQRKGMKAVYGFTVRLGSVGQPRVEPFGNVRREKGKGPVVEEVREPIVDIFDEKEAVVVVAELPGINEKDITVELRDDILTVAAETGEQKYYKEMLLNLPVTPEGLTRSYRNGILEIRICKKKG